MKTVESLKKEIDSIKERNKRVEADKAWETSWARKIIIAVLTYSVIALLFYYAGIERPLINAIVPALAFIISTLTLSFFKGIWKKYFYK